MRRMLQRPCNYKSSPSPTLVNPYSFSQHVFLQRFGWCWFYI